MPSNFSFSSNHHHQTTATTATTASLRSKLVSLGENNIRNIPSSSATTSATETETETETETATATVTATATFNDDVVEKSTRLKGSETFGKKNWETRLSVHEKIGGDIPLRDGKKHNTTFIQKSVRTTDTPTNNRTQEETGDPLVLSGDNRHQKMALLSNPQSLLARDPSELSRMLSLCDKDVSAVRNTVAMTIIMDETVGHGKESTRVQQELEAFTSLNEEEKTPNEGGGGGGGGGGGAKDRESPCLLKNGIFGGNTLLNLCSHSSLASADQPSDAVISTGSKALDRLLSPSVKSLPTRKRPRTAISTETDTAMMTNESHFEDPSSIITGLESGIVTEVCGPSGSGKTQLALTLAANAILQQFSCSSQSISTPWNVRYLIAGGGSTAPYSLARRFRQICRSRLVHSNGERDPRASDEILERIFFTLVPDGYVLLAVLTQLENEFHNNDDDDGKNICNNLIILDSASGCLSSYLYGDGDGNVGAALVNEVYLSLRRLASLSQVCQVKDDDCDEMDTALLSMRMRRNAVFVTNCVVSDTSHAEGGNMRTIRKPALGELWRAAHVRLVFSIVGDVYRPDSDSSKDNNYNDDDDNIPGLQMVIARRLKAQLETHYDKKCNYNGGCSGGSMLEQSAKFSIDASGIVDDEI